MLSHYEEINRKKENRQVLSIMEKILWFRIKDGCTVAAAVDKLKKTCNYCIGIWEEKEPIEEKYIKPKVIEENPLFRLRTLPYIECQRNEVPESVILYFNEDNIFPITKFYRAWDPEEIQTVYKLSTGEICIFKEPSLPTGHVPLWAQTDNE